jgi:hypothetical protein
MKRFLTLLLATVTTAIWTLHMQSARAVDPSRCNGYDQTTACNGWNHVGIGGRRSSMPPSDPGDGGGGGAPAVDPPGTIRLVPCGSNTRASLVGLGDVNAGQDARTCASVDMCDAQTQATGVPHQQYVRMVKQQDGTWSTTGSECDPVTNTPPPVITPLMVWQQAQRLIPTAQIGLAPRHDTLINMETIMWVSTARQRELPTVTILGRPVAVHLRLAHVSWDFGDGHSATTDTPGSAYDPTHDPCKTAQCADYDGHTYTSTGQLTVRATITWRATFRVAGGPATTIPGTLDGPPSTATLLVQQARSVLVPDPTPN